MQLQAAFACVLPDSHIKKMQVQMQSNESFSFLGFAFALLTGMQNQPKLNYQPWLAEVSLYFPL